MAQCAPGGPSPRKSAHVRAVAGGMEARPPPAGPAPRRRDCARAQEGSETAPGAPESDPGTPQEGPKRRSWGSGQAPPP
eukprot:908499-Pyramimonas_sp.AAC.1